jgi:hypothetical protein
MQLDQSGDLEVFGQRRGLEHQHIATLGERPVGRLRAEGPRPRALVVGAAIHDRCARREGAADRRHRVARVGGIAERRTALAR